MKRMLQIGGSLVAFPILQATIPPHNLVTRTTMETGSTSWKQCFSATVTREEQHVATQMQQISTTTDTLPSHCCMGQGFPCMT